MIKAIIFDCYGVLIGDGWLDFKARHFSDDDEKRELAETWGRMVDAGIKRHDEFIAQLAEIIGITPYDVQAEMDKRLVNNQLFDFIEQKKPNFKIGFLSNAGRDRTVELFGEDRMKLFDQVVLSYQVGVVKPQPEIYQIMLERLNLSPNECIFVDDQMDYCLGARALGINTVHFRGDVKSTIQQVEEIIKNA